MRFYLLVKILFELYLFVYLNFQRMFYTSLFVFKEDPCLEFIYLQCQQKTVFEPFRQANRLNLLLHIFCLYIVIIKTLINTNFFQSLNHHYMHFLIPYLHILILTLQNHHLNFIYKLFYSFSISKDFLVLLTRHPNHQQLHYHRYLFCFSSFSFFIFQSSFLSSFSFFSKTCCHNRHLHLIKNRHPLKSYPFSH